jgi:hypothetical protein
VFFSELRWARGNNTDHPFICLIPDCFNPRQRSHPGDVVRVFGLVSFHLLNTNLVQVDGPGTSEERLAVSIFGGEKPVSIKKANLKVIIPGEERLDTAKYHTSDCPCGQCNGSAH